MNAKSAVKIEYHNTASLSRSHYHTNICAGVTYR